LRRNLLYKNADSLSIETCIDYVTHVGGPGELCEPRDEVATDLGIPLLPLDDFLSAIDDTRAQFKLPKPHFGLEQLERGAGAKKALSEITAATKKKYGTEICSKRHFLLEELGLAIYAGKITNSAFSGYWRISPLHVDRALRRVFEIALQTLSQLPARDSKVARAKDKLVSLASHFSKLATKVDSAIQTEKRIGEYLKGESSGERLRLLGLPAELRRAAETLKQVSSKSRIPKLRINSPKPQVRFALYLAGWIEACTGKKHYKHLQTLAAAAFAVADQDRDPPKWVDRLEIEMTRKMGRRRRWIKTISVKS
jgi:hypothetical protein